MNCLLFFLTFFLLALVIFLATKDFLRNTERSTTIVRDRDTTSLSNYESCVIRTTHLDWKVVILDIRMPCNPLARLKNHSASVNGIAWAPHSNQHICTAADDKQALIWDVQCIPRPVEDPILAYTAAGEVNQVHWGSVHKNWISICFGKTLEILRV